jgi:hypothetical protein
VNPSEAYRIAASTPDLLVLQELPYAVVGWLALASGLFMAGVAAFTHWRFGSPRTTFFVLSMAGGVCALLGVWLMGLQYEFSFWRGRSAIEIRMSWFGRTVSDERLNYTVPPIADIVVTKRTTRQLVLRFQDGRTKTLGLSTDREGHEEAVQLINRFLQTGSVLQ